MQDKKYDLEERTLKFSYDCIDLCKLIGANSINTPLIGQLIRAAGSVGANYREANESTTKKDFYHRIGICRKESKESRYWLKLLLHANPSLYDKIGLLIDEALQLAKIFSSISRNSL